MKNRLRALSIFICILLISSLFASCSGSDNKSIMTVNGLKVPVRTYRYAMQTIMLQLYQINGASVEELAKQNYKIDNTPIKDYLSQAAQEQCVYYALVSQLFDELGYKFDDNMKSILNTYMSNTEEQYGGTAQFESVLASNGYTRKMVEDNLISLIKTQQIKADYYGESGTEPVKEADAKTYFNNSYARVKHILFLTKDATTSQPLPAGDIAAKKTTYDKILAELKANGANFDKYVTQYNEDPGAAENPDGYFVYPNSSFDEAFEKESLSLKVGEIGAVESGSGFHIIKRFPITEENFQSQKDSVLDKLRQDKLEAELDKRKGTATVEKDDELLAKVDAALFTISYGESTDGTTDGTATAPEATVPSTGTNP